MGRWLVSLFALANFASAQPLPDSCYPGLATVGSYSPSPEQVAEAIGKRVTSDTFSFPLPHPLTVKQGDKVDVTTGKLPAPGQAVKNVTEATPVSRSGIFVGTATDASGVEQIILDFGGGRFGRVPTSAIRSLLRSSAKLKPSTGTVAEALYARAKAVKTIATDLVFPAVGQMAKAVFPTSVGFYFTYSAVHAGLDWGNQLFQSHPYETVGALALGVTGLVASKAARQLTSVAIQLPHAAGKSLGNLGVLAWTIATNYRSYVENLAVNLRISKLASVSQAIVGTAKTRGTPLLTEVDGIGRVAYLGQDKNLRTFIHLPDGSADKGFLVKAQAGHREAVQLKDYLVSLGVPDLGRPLNVWISDKGIPKLPGPFSAEGLNLLYMGPISFTQQQRETFAKQEAADGGKRVLSTNESLDQLGTDGTVFGHELTHALIHNLLAGKGAISAVQGPIEEALADYFPMSAKDLKEPVLGFGQQYEGLPAREAVQREYEGDYPKHLNFNTVAQISGDVHGSSQVIGRYLWQLRSKMGRDRLDKLIVQALPHVSRYRRQSEPLFTTPPSYGKAGDPIAKFRNQREAYVFVAALMHASRERDGESAESEAIAQLAGPFGMPPEVLMAIHEIKLDPVLVEKADK